MAIIPYDTKATIEILNSINKEIDILTNKVFEYQKIIDTTDSIKELALSNTQFTEISTKINNLKEDRKYYQSLEWFTSLLMNNELGEYPNYRLLWDITYQGWLSPKAIVEDIERIAPLLKEILNK